MKEFFKRWWWIILLVIVIGWWWLRRKKGLGVMPGTASGGPAPEAGAPLGGSGTGA